MSYDSPHATVQREFCANAGGAGTTEYAKFRSFAAGFLKNVSAVVTVAGTVTGHGFDVYVGTSSVGTIPLSTNTAGVSATVAINQSVAALQSMSVKSLADTAGKADIVFQYNHVG